MGLDDSAVANERSPTEFSLHRLLVFILGTISGDPFVVPIPVYVNSRWGEFLCGFAKDFGVSSVSQDVLTNTAV